MVNSKLKNKLKSICKEKQTKIDPSHDFSHILRVLNLAVKIGMDIKADLDVIIPAALFHDIVVYKKDSKKSKGENKESAVIAARILNSIPEYPKSKIHKVVTCIEECSFTKMITPKLLESKVLQDADHLEATGVISIMRTFASCGYMNTPFYAPNDPLCNKGVINFRSGIDLFYKRLLVIEKIMHTRFARRIAKKRTRFLNQFLKQLKIELTESDIIKS